MLFKEIPKEYFLTILDRLFRFEPANIRFKRVVNDIISKFYLGKNKKLLSDTEKLTIAAEIFNNSLKADLKDEKIIKIITELEDRYFIYNEQSYQYLSTRLNYSSALKQIENFEKIPTNLIWLKETISSNENILKLRETKGLLYPIETVLLCEGQTEYILLNTILKLFSFDLNKKGIYLYPAGGKNQVARKFYQMSDYLKLPFFILLDKDGESVVDLIKNKLRKIDKIYLLKSGEFEDIIPKKLLISAINQYHDNDFKCNFDDFCDEISMVHNLELIYRKYGYGDFKKAHFASIVNDFIRKYCHKDDFMNSEITNIKQELQNFI